MSMASSIITPTNFITTLGSSRADRAPTPLAQGINTQKTKRSQQKNKIKFRKIYKTSNNPTKSHFLPLTCMKKPHFKWAKTVKMMPNGRNTREGHILRPGRHHRGTHTKNQTTSPTTKQKYGLELGFTRNGLEMPCGHLQPISCETQL